jgi:hypothetical protein
MDPNDSNLEIYLYFLIFLIRFINEYFKTVLHKNSYFNTFLDLLYFLTNLPCSQAYVCKGI